MKRLFSYFSPFEWGLLLTSLCVILVAPPLFGTYYSLSTVASLVGAVALAFTAKGNPIGQALFVVFGVLYGIISYGFAYYGEMLTYVGMSVPMALLSLVTWLRNPSGRGHAEVRIGRLSRRDALQLPLLTVAVTVAVYFLLDVFGTANLLPSTVSVATSFVAVYLTARRSPLYALAYALNDVVLILLWVLAALQNTSYLAVVLCFLMFLVNDVYGYISWMRRRRQQQ